jgi:transcriptional regulator with XRE-family HTH domain
MNMATVERPPRVRNAAHGAAHSVTREEHKKFSPNKLIDAMRGTGGSDEITAQQLAEETGSSVEAIARWMAGIAVPRPGNVTHVARVLDVSVDDLYE